MSPTTRARTVPTRRVSFEANLQGVPRRFAGSGDLIGSHLIAALSALFPDGEEFFVRSVRKVRDQVTDPELRRQVAGFIGQEALHGREHRALNDRLDELGYPTKRFERFTRRSLALRERLMSELSNLAATAALERLRVFTVNLVTVGFLGTVVVQMALSRQQWRDELFGADGRLTGLLARPGSAGEAA